METQNVTQHTFFTGARDASWFEPSDLDFARSDYQIAEKQLQLLTSARSHLDVLQFIAPFEESYGATVAEQLEDELH